MSLSEERTPLMVYIDEDVIEQRVRAPASDERRALLWMRRVAPVFVVVFLCIVLSSRAAEGLNFDAERVTSGGAQETNDADGPRFPDFSRYGERLQTLSPSQLHFKVGGRLIVVGDIHGMKEPLDHLLKKLRFRPHKDKLVHAGDTLTKGPQPMEVLEFLTANNVSGVRGNHDQKIIEWRSWFNWVRSFPDGENWIERYEDRIYRAISMNTNDQSIPHGTTSPGEESTPKKFPFPDDWKWGSPHWRIAYDMTNEQYEYLLSLPLVLHIPTLHTMIVHAGLLPANPQKSLTSRHQPLARIPVLAAGSVPSEEQLRMAQETAVVNDVPQNRDPWVITNLRSLLGSGRVSKESGKGTPWPDLWNKIMKRCAGFNAQSRKGSRTLPCRPFTVVYGHAASRGKDIREWSKGVDSGCVYGRKLSALVYSESSSFGKVQYETDTSIEVEATVLGHNIGEAQIISVKCD